MIVSQQREHVIKLVFATKTRAFAVQVEDWPEMRYKLEKIGFTDLPFNPLPLWDHLKQTAMTSHWFRRGADIVVHELSN